ncbi:hypothetical protein ACGF5C_05105 [Micromonospora sp. NPDC047620]
MASAMQTFAPPVVATAGSTGADAPLVVPPHGIVAGVVATSHAWAAGQPT